MNLTPRQQTEQIEGPKSRKIFQIVEHLVGGDVQIRIRFASETNNKNFLKPPRDVCVLCLIHFPLHPFHYLLSLAIMSVGEIWKRASITFPLVLQLAVGAITIKSVVTPAPVVRIALFGQETRMVHGWLNPKRKEKRGKMYEGLVAMSLGNSFLPSLSSSLYCRLLRNDSDL